MFCREIFFNCYLHYDSRIFSSYQCTKTPLFDHLRYFYTHYNSVPMFLAVPLTENEKKTKK